jgi:DNA-binding NarL/FixJ family response regulator
MESTLISCIIVDDHPPILRALSAVLQDDGIDVIGRAERGAEALALLDRRKPNVALVDLLLPDGSGIDLIRAAADVAPSTACLVYTGFPSARNAREALDAGACGIVSKESPLASLARAISIVASGGTYVDGLVAGEFAESQAVAPTMTRRERDVLHHLADGLSNEQVGAELHISAETVRGYVRNAMARLGARNRTQAVAAAVRAGIIS